MTASAAAAEGNATSGASSTETSTTATTTTETSTTETTTTATTTTTVTTTSSTTTSSTDPSWTSTTTTTTPPRAPPIGSVVARHGYLSVNGSAIVDESGTPVRLRGMSLFWSQWMSQFWNAAVVRWLRDDWGITIVRAAMAVEAGGYLTQPEIEQERVELIVEAAIEAGIYVIIDWHDHAADQHLDASKRFFAEMGQKYGTYPNVLFEVFNEPTMQDWSTQIKPYHEKVVPVIRRYSENLIILGTRFWSQDVDGASRDPVEGYNLAYTLHFYANTHGQFLRDKALAAMESGVAIFVTEWGTCSADGNGMVDFTESQIWLDFLAQHNISDANWAVADKEEACAALMPGSSSDGGWGMNDLTESGRWVRDSLLQPR